MMRTWFWSSIKDGGNRKEEGGEEGETRNEKRGGPCLRDQKQQVRKKPPGEPSLDQRLKAESLRQVHALRPTYL